MRVRVLVLALLATLGVAAPASAATPTITVQAPSHVSVAGNSITFHTTYAGWQNGTLSVTVEGAGSAAVSRPLAFPVDDGSYDFEWTPSVNTRVTMSITDGSGTRSASWYVGVRPRIATTLHTGYTKVVAYDVMRRGVSPVFRSGTYPKRPGQMCLRHQLQRYRDGAWRAKLVTACRVEDSTGRVSWKWAGSHPSRVRFRVRATFPGDARNLAGSGPWLYFRFR